MTFGPKFRYFTNDQGNGINLLKFFRPGSSTECEVSGPNEFDLNEQIAGLNEKIDHLKGQFSGLESRVLSSVNELRSELTVQIQNVDITRSEVSFKFELPGVSGFSQIDGNCYCSDRFWCRGLPWCVCVKSEHGDPQAPLKFVALYLRCESEDQTEWACMVDYQFTFFSKFPGKNVVRKASHFFNRMTPWSFSTSKNYSSLTDKRNGHTENDKMLLGVEMKAGPVARG